MGKQRLLVGSFASLGILILILDGKTALAGAQAGVELCIKTVIPALFPFILLSIWINASFTGNPIPLLRPIARLLDVPEGAESILIIGFWGGYPTGAQAIASGYHAKQLSKSDAARMLGFCSNAGPAFLFGIISHLFSQPHQTFVLWGIHIFSAVLTGLFLRGDAPAPARYSPKGFSPSHAMPSAISVTASVCGWVILFRVLIAFRERWFLWIFPAIWQAGFAGILELSNGCCMLMQIQNENLRFVLCSGFLAWGGICVAMQTRSVTQGLPFVCYLKGKLLQTVFSILLAVSYALNILLPAAAMLFIPAFLLKKYQKRYSIPAAAGV